MRSRSLVALLLGWFLACAALDAQPTATGAIEGRVFDAGRGEYLENARITIEGTGAETLTDSTGQFRLANVPTGTVRVKVFFTGLASQLESVVVTAGQIAVHDFTFGSPARAEGPKAGDIVKLSAFQVSSSKEMEGSAIAVNEQRFARNIVNVLSADEFGPVVDGAVGEFMKFIPGVRMDYTNGDPRLITLDGVPPSNVPISIGGFDVVSTGGGSHLSRQVALDQVSLNNVARLEVNRSPTPDVSGSALAGSVNFVPRSALLLGNWIFRGLGWEGGYRALLIALLALVTLSPLLARFQMPTAEKFARRQKDRGGIFSTSFRFFRLTNHQHTMKRLALLASTLLASSLFAAETSDAEVRARFQDLDTNHDGKLSPEEFKAFPAAARMPDLLLGNWIFRGLGWEGGCRSGAGRNAHERNLPGRRRPGLHRHSRKRLRHFGRTARGAEHRPAQRTLKV